MNEDDPLSIRYHSVQLLVKMEPDDTVDHHGPDLGLVFSERSLEKHAKVTEDL